MSYDTPGEPAELALPGERARQAVEAARILGVDRLSLHHQDRMLVDDVATRLEVAGLIREHRPHTVYATLSGAALRLRCRAQTEGTGVELLLRSRARRVRHELRPWRR